MTVVHNKFGYDSRWDLLALEETSIPLYGRERIDTPHGTFEVAGRRSGAPDVTKIFRFSEFTGWDELTSVVGPAASDYFRGLQDQPGFRPRG